MNAKDVRVDLEELRSFKKRNFEEKLKFIEFLINYMKEHFVKEWSGQQAEFIDAQFKGNDGFFWEI